MNNPVIVKSASMHGSVGIAQASVVSNDEKLKERVEFIHDHIQTDTIVEEYIEGRELYVGVIGNRRLQVLPVWEMVFKNMPDGTVPIATARVKHDPEYQEKRGIMQQEAQDLGEGMADRIARITKRIYRILELDGYARIDYRLGRDGTLYFLEANANPDIGKSEEFASSADAAGIPYPELIRRILSLGLRRAGR